jgi:hypothetical protein
MIVLLLLISPSLTAANLTVSSLSDGVFLMRSERAVEGYGVVSGNGLIVKTAADKAVLIDTPGMPAMLKSYLTGWHRSRLAWKRL